MQQDLAFLSIAEATTRYRTGNLSPVDVTNAALHQMKQYAGPLNAFVATTEARAQREALASQARWAAGAPLGPLDGVPLSVKDTLMVQGMPFRRGSRATSETPVNESAPVVDHIFGAGAVMLGITTTPEFGAGPVTISPLTGITRNPWDLDKNSGGSSGGAAAAVAAGMGLCALATDAGGSTRVPSALCGAVGFKPTGGRIATYPPNVAGTLSSPGLIARSAEDIAILMNVVTRNDPRDPEMLPANGVDYLLAITATPLQQEKPRIAFTTTMGYAKKVDPDVAERVTEAARHFEQLGFIVEEADPGITDPIDDFLTLFRSGFAYTVRNFSDEQMAVVGETLRDVVEQGRQVTVAHYLAAQDARRLLARKLQAFHARYSLLLLPTVAVGAFTADRWTPEDFAAFDNMRAWTPFALLFNLTQQPAISVPCGLTSQGLPVGLQIVGPRFADADVLRAARLYETTRPFAWPRPAFRNLPKDAA